MQKGRGGTADERKLTWLGRELGHVTRLNTSCPVTTSSQPATQILRNHPNVAIVLQDHKNTDIIHFIGAIGTNAW